MESASRWNLESPGGAGQRRGTIQRDNWDSGPGAGPRAALDLPGLCVVWTRTQGRPAPCPLGYRRLRPESSSAFRSFFSLAEARVAAINEKARQCSSQRRSPQEVY